MVAAEKVPELLFERGIVESCGDELLATKMTNYLQKRDTLTKFMGTSTVQRFREHQLTQGGKIGPRPPPLAIKPSQDELSQAFVDKVSQYLRLEHKEFDRKMLEY